MTFDSTVGFLSSTSFQKLKVKIFPRVSRSIPFEELHRWQPLKGRQQPYKVCHLVKRVGAIKGPKHLQTEKRQRGDFPKSCSLLGHFLHISPLFQTHIYTQKHSQNKSKPLDSSLHQKYKVLSLYPIFFSLVLHLGFGVQGCGCSFLAIIHTRNFLNLFLAFILLFLP